MTPGLAAPVAIDRSRDANWLDLDLDPACPWTLVVLAQVPVGKVIDVLATLVFLPLDHATEDLRPAPHVLWIHEEKRDPRVALEMLEPATVGAPIDPEESLGELEPDRNLFDAPILTRRANEGREHLLDELLHLGAELHRHYTTSHLNSRAAISVAMPSQITIPRRSVRMAPSGAPH